MLHGCLPSKDVRVCPPRVAPRLKRCWRVRSGGGRVSAQRGFGVDTGNWFEKEMEEWSSLARVETGSAFRGNRRIEQGESRTESSYSYYQSVTVVGDGSPWNMQSTPGSIVPFGGNIFTFVLLAFGVIYAFLTYRFNRNYKDSTFRADQRMKLSLIWPGLLVSPEFREKFKKIVTENQRNEKKEE